MGEVDWALVPRGSQKGKGEVSGGPGEAGVKCRLSVSCPWPKPWGPRRGFKEEPEFPPPVTEPWRGQWHPTAVFLSGKYHGQRSLVGYSPWGLEESDTTDDFTFTFHLHALEKEMATHSSVHAWRIPGTGEPGGLPSMGSHRVGHD